jgi:hypothetical protein
MTLRPEWLNVCMNAPVEITSVGVSLKTSEAQRVRDFPNMAQEVSVRAITTSTPRFIVFKCISQDSGFNRN